MDTTASITVTFPETWRNAIIRQDVLDTLFHVYHAVSNQPDLSHIARQCLVHLASIQGPIFTANLSRQESSNARKAFIGHYSALFLDYLSR